MTRSGSPEGSPPDLREAVWRWVIREKTSDGCGLYDSRFMIHAQQAIDWIVEYVQASAPTGDTPQALREAQAGNRGRNHPYVFDVYIGSACLRCGLEMNHHLHCGPFGPRISRSASAGASPHEEKADGLLGCTDSGIQNDPPSTSRRPCMLPQSFFPSCGCTLDSRNGDRVYVCPEHFNALR